MYMTEFIVIATRYMFCYLNYELLLYRFLRRVLQRTLEWTNVTVSLTELKTRCNKPVIQHESKNQTFFHSYERTSCVDYTTGSLIKNLCAYVLILFYMTKTLKKCFYSGKLTDFENENKGHRLRCRCPSHFCHHCLGWTRTAHAFDLTSLVDSLPRETCVGEILSFGAWKCLVSLTAVFGIVTQRNGEERCVTTLKTAV